MLSFVYIAMLGWIPVALWLFLTLPPRKALIISFLAAWLFLPIASFSVAGLPNYTKVMATCLPALMGLALFDPNHRLLSFRVQWLDLPMVVWCISPIVSTVTNDLGSHEAFSALFDQFVAWGFPYLFGRVYLRTPEGLRELAKGIIIGGLIYVPLCLFEIRMSPQLHTMVYGFGQQFFLTAMRYGGYRPTVFLEHGLAVSLWMSIATFLLLTLRRAGALRKLGPFSLGPCVILLLVTTILCKSVAAVIWLAVGVGVYSLTRRLRVRYLMLALIACVPVFLTGRLVLDWSGAEVVSWTQSFDQDRSDSLSTRLYFEDLLKKKAFERPLFGWGRFGRSRIFDETGKDITITDSMWIIVLGQNGLVGMVSLFLSLLLPPLIVAIRLPPKDWARPSTAPIAIVALAVVLYTLDLLLNPVFNPLFMLMVGGVASFPKMKLESRKTAAAVFPQSRAAVA